MYENNSVLAVFLQAALPMYEDIYHDSGVYPQFRYEKAFSEEKDEENP
jgi:hypothetical protein